MSDGQVQAPNDINSNRNGLAECSADLLTGREKQVLGLLADGFQYKQIAFELDISIKTVEFHASNILRKLGVANRYELADKWRTQQNES